MSVKDWLELDKEEKIGSFDVILDSIKYLTDKEMNSLVMWFIDCLTIDEQLRVINREGKSTDYLEQLDYFLECLLVVIVEGVYVATGVRV